MKTAVLDIYGGVCRKAASLLVALPRLDRRYVAAAMLTLPVLVLGPYAVPFMLSLAFFAAAVGVIATLAARSGYSLWYVAALLLASVPFMGVVSSVEALPNWMQIVAHLLPVMYVFEGVRTLVAFGAFDSAAFVASVLLTGMYLFFVYLWVSARAERKGQYDTLKMID